MVRPDILYSVSEMIESIDLPLDLPTPPEMYVIIRREYEGVYGVHYAFEDHSPFNTGRAISIAEFRESGNAVVFLEEVFVTHSNMPVVCDKIFADLLTLSLTKAGGTIPYLSEILPYKNTASLNIDDVARHRIIGTTKDGGGGILEIYVTES